MIKYLFYFSLIFMIAGCSASSIKIKAFKDENPHAMFGKNNMRDFEYLDSAVDSIKFLWSFEANGSFPTSSVAVYDSFVFVNELSGRIHCIDMKTGKSAGQLKNKGAIFTTPLIHNFMVIFADALFDENKTILYYYDFVSGKSMHEIEVPGRIITELVKAEDGIIFTTENGKVFRYNYKGIKVWENSFSFLTHSTPALKDNMLIFGNDKGNIIAIDSRTGSVIYEKDIGESFFCGPVIHNNQVFIGNDNGKIYCLELNSGNIKWEYSTGARILMHPVVSNGKVYIGNLRGDLYSLDIETGKVFWKTSTDGVFNSTPVITSKYLLLPDLTERLHFVDISTGKIVKSQSFSGRMKLSPVVFKNVLFIGYDRGILEAYEIIN